MRKSYTPGEVATARALAALILRGNGWKWEAIAQGLHYSHEQSAIKAVQRLKRRDLHAPDRRRAASPQTIRTRQALEAAGGAAARIVLGAPWSEIGALMGGRDPRNAMRSVAALVERAGVSMPPALPRHAPDAPVPAPMPD